MEINITIKDVESTDVMFDKNSSRYWEDSAEMNRLQLISLEGHANRRLKLKGHLFLNELYDMLGLPDTSLGALMGWVYDENKKISFGLSEEYLKNPTLTVPLHFNIDGVIVNKI